MTTLEMDDRLRDWLLAREPGSVPETLRAAAARVPYEWPLPAHARFVEVLPWWPTVAQARRPVAVLLVVMAVLAAIIVTALLAGAPRRSTSVITNGWVAFAAGGPDPSGEQGERDIYLVAEAQPARRIVGTDSDLLDQICPAFSPDGTRLAYGEAKGTEYGGYRAAALVVVDLDRDGDVSRSQRIPVGGEYPPPCATWSPDGRQVAFGVTPTRLLDPEPSANRGETWVVTLESGQISVLSDLSPSDLEWSPDGAQLAIAGRPLPLGGGARPDGMIRLYSVLTGEWRTLVGPTGAQWLSWSPDGGRIAYQRAHGPTDDTQDLLVVDVDRGSESLLVADFAALHGIGPVWSPVGDRIVYQRVCTFAPTSPTYPCGEEHEVVLLSPTGESQILPPVHRAGTDVVLYPFRVTWSPDGEKLLYLAWGWPVPVPPEGRGDAYAPVLVAVPIDPKAPPVILPTELPADWISIYDEDGKLPTQSWGREPSGG